MDNEHQVAWVQVVGQVAVHCPPAAPLNLEGSSRTLLQALVAGGPGGIGLDDLATAYWPSQRPASWELALRLVMSHLESQLPPTWRLDVGDDVIQLDPASGWVDAWQPAIDRPRNDRHSSTDTALGEVLSTTRRVIITRRPDQLEVLTRIDVGDIDTVSMVVGDERLCLALGPFLIAFPELRSMIARQNGSITADEACRHIVRSIAAAPSPGRHRIGVADAHLLDKASLQLLSYLIERGPTDAFSLTVCADHRHRDIRWRDFLSRALTAGCTLLRIEEWDT